VYRAAVFSMVAFSGRTTVFSETLFTAAAAMTVAIDPPIREPRGSCKQHLATGKAKLWESRLSILS
jgi:hypothetical protein